jgi:methyl-accepting chemotaxis protein
MSWTFGRKIGVGFGLSILMLFLVGALGYRSIDGLIENNARVTHSHAVLEKIAALHSVMKDAETGQRGFVITGEESFLEPYDFGIKTVDVELAELRRLTVDTSRQQSRLDEIETITRAKRAELKRVIDVRRVSGAEAAAKLVREGIGKQYMDDLRRLVGQLDQEERQRLHERTAAAEASARAAKVGVGAAAVVALLLLIGASLAITRSLGTQLGAAVTRIRSSSTELQAAAAQQASGSREQLSSTTEVATTMRELLATSRQITESAQRVSSVAEQTLSGAKTGTHTMQGARDAITGMKLQMDVVVGHMLELGKKSQQAGGILDLVNELSEQTNILAINATIEAAGAGESGRRFSVVADEIRKLADRVGGSTKEIRAIIDDMRASVNTTVMATESGVKAVEVGATRFSEVTSSFQGIADMVATTTEAAREIELSTKQQASAVEQVTSAIGGVAQATREWDTSARQTLQAASELTELSRSLLRLVDDAAA